jgi:predicted small secreted protein
MKKLTAMAVVLIMVCCLLTACRSGNGNDTTGNGNTNDLPGTTGATITTPMESTKPIETTRPNTTTMPSGSGTMPNGTDSNGGNNGGTSGNNDNAGGTTGNDSKQRNRIPGIF